MAMSYIWSGLVILSFLWGFFHGNLSAVAAAALDGAQSALELSLSMAGILCLWSGVMEILNVCGLSRRIAALFRPLLRRLLPNASRDEETLAGSLRQCLREPSGPWQRRHAAGHPSRPADGPKLRWRRQ